MVSLLVTHRSKLRFASLFTNINSTYVTFILYPLCLGFSFNIPTLYPLLKHTITLSSQIHSCAHYVRALIIFFFTLPTSCMGLFLIFLLKSSSLTGFLSFIGLDMRLE